MLCVVWAGDDGQSLIVLCLEGKQQHEGHHKTEETHSLGQSKAQDGIREQLLLKTRVAGIADDQAAKDCSDTSSY